MTTQDAHQDASLQEDQQPSDSPQWENPQTNNEQPADKGPSAFSRFVRKHPIATAIIAGILLAGIVWLWKDIEGSVEQKRLIKAANEQLQTNQDAALKLLAKPMVWSIRAEWMRGNKEQVELMLVDVIKGSDLLYLHFLDMSGKVIVSTDKRLEGLTLEDPAVNAALNTDTTVLLPKDKKTEATVLVAPVMGYDRRLGTLVMAGSSHPLLVADH